MDWMKDLQHKRAGGLASSTDTLLGMIILPNFVSVTTAHAKGLALQCTNHSGEIAQSFSRMLLPQ
jgi:hypothetical protein